MSYIARSLRPIINAEKINKLVLEICCQQISQFMVVKFGIYVSEFLVFRETLSSDYSKNFLSRLAVDSVSFLFPTMQCLQVI